MPEYAQTATHSFALGMAVLHAVLLGAIIYRTVSGSWLAMSARPHMQRLGLAVAAFFPVAATVLAFWYSEWVGIPVCVLCWLGRTMMFPLAGIVTLAAWRKDTAVIPYALSLAVVGALITGYHHLLQIGIVDGALCDAFAQGGGCEARYVWELGYITMPLFGFTIFSVTGLLLWIRARV